MIGYLRVDLSIHACALVDLDLIATMILNLLIWILNQNHGIPIHVFLPYDIVTELEILNALSDVVTHLAIIRITCLNHISLFANFV